MQDLIDAYIECTIQQGEWHKTFAEVIKNFWVGTLSQCLSDLRIHKTNWTSSIEMYNKGFSVANKNVEKLEKKLRDRKAEFEAMEDKKQQLLDKLDEFDEDNPPKEIIQIEKKVDDLAEFVSKLSLRFLW
jgi:predicted RNase H-like nuclease (RuvC/YqgF family)